MWPQAARPDAVLLTRPYLQLGQGFASGRLDVVWHASPGTSEWRLLRRSSGESAWTESSSPRRVPGVNREVWTAEIQTVRPGGSFEYELRQGDVIRSSGRGRAPVSPGEPLTFAVTGDVGDGSANERAIVERMLARHRTRPIDFALIAGDVAYECGRAEEYGRKFYPIYNPPAGESLMAEVPFAVALGNHDVGDLRWPLPPFRCSSDYSWFQFWRHPTGFGGVMPVGPRHGPKAPSIRLPGPDPDVRRVLAAANYSFTWGDAHVTVIDSNRYVNWTDRSLGDWLETDLALARNSRWRFVLMHHPPFNRSRDHRGDQWTRFLAPIFERHGVTAVFSGHVHNFQWLGPARFRPNPAEVGRFAAGSRGVMSGTLEVQQDYDGRTRTDARWPVYVITGAGGGDLVAEGGGCPPDTTVPYGCGDPSRAEGREPSVTLVDVGPGAVTIRQVAATGATLLERRITRRVPAR